MITGTHTIIYSKNAEALRAWFRDVLEFPSVDAGQEWLIFALPPSELAVHPTDDETRHELYLMCDDIEETVARLESKGVKLIHPVTDRSWGRLTAVRMPDGGQLGLYEPRHPTAHGSGREGDQHDVEG